MNWLRGDEHLAAEVAALLLGRELVLEVHARRARLDHGLHELEGVERAAEARLGVGDDRRQPVAAVAAPLGMLDLVGAEQRLVEPADERRRRCSTGRGSGRGRSGRRGSRPPRPASRRGRSPRRPALTIWTACPPVSAPRAATYGSLLEQLPEPLRAPAGERVLDDRPIRADARRPRRCRASRFLPSDRMRAGLLLGRRQLVCRNGGQELGRELRIRERAPSRRQPAASAAAPRRRRPRRGSWLRRGLARPRSRRRDATRAGPTARPASARSRRWPRPPSGCRWRRHRSPRARTSR